MVDGFHMSVVFVSLNFHINIFTMYLLPKDKLILISCYVLKATGNTTKCRIELRTSGTKLKCLIARSQSRAGLLLQLIPQGRKKSNADQGLSFKPTF